MRDVFCLSYVRLFAVLTVMLLCPMACRSTSPSRADQKAVGMIDQDQFGRESVRLVWYEYRIGDNFVPNRICTSTCETRGFREIVSQVNQGTISFDEGLRRFHREQGGFCRFNGSMTEVVYNDFIKRWRQGQLSWRDESSVRSLNFDIKLRHISSVDHTDPIEIALFNDIFRAQELNPNARCENFPLGFIDPFPTPTPTPDHGHDHNNPIPPSNFKYLRHPHTGLYIVQLQPASQVSDPFRRCRAIGERWEEARWGDIQLFRKSWRDFATAINLAVNGFYVLHSELRDPSAPIEVVDYSSGSVHSRFGQSSMQYPLFCVNRAQMFSGLEIQQAPAAGSNTGWRIPEHMLDGGCSRREVSCGSCINGSQVCGEIDCVGNVTNTFTRSCLFNPDPCRPTSTRCGTCGPDNFRSCDVFDCRGQRFDTTREKCQGGGPICNTTTSCDQCRDHQQNCRVIDCRNNVINTFNQQCHDEPCQTVEECGECFNGQKRCEKKDCRGNLLTVEFKSCLAPPPPPPTEENCKRFLMRSDCELARCKWVSVVGRPPSCTLP